MIIDELKMMKDKGYPITFDAYRRIRYLEKIGQRFPNHKAKYDKEIQEIKEMIKTGL